MPHYKKMENEIGILLETMDIKDKKIIDVGSGVGKIAKLLSDNGAIVYGLDLPEIIAQKDNFAQGENVILKAGTAQEMPFEDSFADIVLFFYSFHHIPQEFMDKAIAEAARVVKPGGLVVFTEPVSEPGTYYELSRLKEDEAEIQKTALSFIKGAGNHNLQEIDEKYFYFLRGFSRFTEQMNIYIDNPEKRKEIIDKAVKVIESMNEKPETVQLKSLCRMNLFKL